MRPLVALLASLATTAALAAGEPEFNISIQDHRFTPDKLEVPAGKKLKFIVDNKDATPAEFESDGLKVEKVIKGKSRATIFVGPLKPGEYKFEDEFNPKTAQGVVVAK